MFFALFTVPLFLMGDDGVSDDMLSDRSDDTGGGLAEVFIKQHHTIW